MLLVLLFTSLLLPTHDSSAYALIDLNALSAEHSLTVEVEAAEEVTVSNDEKEEGIEKVEVRHKQKGLLLALWPITFTVRGVVTSDGNVELFYPWYSAITVDHREEIKAKVKVAVDNALKARLVGSVRAEGTPSNPRFTLEEAAMVRSVVEKALSSSLTSDQ